MQTGVSVAQLARENNINDNLLFNWRRLYQQELLAARTEAPVMLPVMLAAESGPKQTRPISGHLFIPVTPIATVPALIEVAWHPLPENFQRAENNLG